MAGTHVLNTIPYKNLYYSEELLTNTKLELYLNSLQTAVASLSDNGPVKTLIESLLTGDISPDSIINAFNKIEQSYSSSSLDPMYWVPLGFAFDSSTTPWGQSKAFCSVLLPIIMPFYRINNGNLYLSPFGGHMHYVRAFFQIINSLNYGSFLGLGDGGRYQNVDITNGNSSEQVANKKGSRFFLLGEKRGEGYSPRSRAPDIPQDYPEIYPYILTIKTLIGIYSKWYDYVLKNILKLKSYKFSVDAIPDVITVIITKSDSLSFFITNYVSRDTRYSLQEIISSKGDKYTRYHDPDNASLVISEGWSQWQRDDINAVGNRTFLLLYGDFKQMPLGTQVGLESNYNSLIPRQAANTTWTVFTQDYNIYGLPECMRSGSEENPLIKLDAITKNDNKGITESEDRVTINLEKDETGSYPFKPGSVGSQAIPPLAEQQRGIATIHFNGERYLVEWKPCSPASRKWVSEENVPRYTYSAEGFLIQEAGQEYISWSKWYRHDNIQTVKNLGSYTAYDLLFMQKNKRELADGQLSVMSIFGLFDQPENTTYSITIFDPEHLVAGLPDSAQDGGPAVKYLGINSNRAASEYAILNLRTFDTSQGRLTSSLPTLLEKNDSSNTIDKLNNIINISEVYYTLTYSKTEHMDTIEFKGLGNLWCMYAPYEKYRSLDTIPNSNRMSIANKTLDNSITFNEEEVLKSVLNSNKLNNLILGDTNTKNLQGQEYNYIVKKQFHVFNVADICSDLLYSLKEFGPGFIWYKFGRKFSDKTIKFELWHSIDSRLLSAESRLTNLEVQLGSAPGSLFKAPEYASIDEVGLKFHFQNKVKNDHYQNKDYFYGGQQFEPLSFEVAPSNLLRYGIDPMFLGHMWWMDAQTPVWPCMSYGQGTITKFLDMVNTLLQEAREVMSFDNEVEEKIDMVSARKEFHEWTRTGSRVDTSLWGLLDESLLRGWVVGVFTYIILAILGLLYSVLRMLLFIYKVFHEILCIPIWTWRVCPLEPIAYLIKKGILEPIIKGILNALFGKDVIPPPEV
jgi:hypothetical protein